MPLRVVWLPPERKGQRSFRISDFVRFGDLRDPDPARQRWIYSRHPELVRIVVGACARGADLRARWEESVSDMNLSEFISRQAHLALEKAERELRGARYKVPKFIHDEVLRRREFRRGVGRIAAELGEKPAKAWQQAQRYLREIAATHNIYVIDVAANAIHGLYSQGYRDLNYDPDLFGQITRLSEEFPVAFLPSHKSNLDHLVLQYLLWENGLPPNHTAGGINMSFFPAGPLVRHTGVFFIRRSFRDNPLYKWVLQSYIDYLVEKRFPLEWYLEGGRSRSGKLMPPRYGMLSYVADSFRRGLAEDVYLIPVAIAYDQIQDVPAHAAEQQGVDKERESLPWLVRAVRSLRRRHGSIYVSFGEPISMAKELTPVTDPETARLEVQKLAFEVLVRIGQESPITAPALVVSALLGQIDRALTSTELMADVTQLLDHVDIRGWPLAPNVDLRTTEDLHNVVEILQDHRIVSTYDEGLEPVFSIDPKRHLEAAYYRNTIVHFFVAGGIAEVALLAAANSSNDYLDRLWNAVSDWRDLLKFEFFFSPKTVFSAEVRSELEQMDPEWEQVPRRGPEAVDQLLSRARPLRAHWVLRPWLEGYQVVADSLARHDRHRPVNRDELLEDCLTVGRQYLLQRRISSPESVSRVIFESALRLASNRALVDPEAGHLQQRRDEFADEIALGLERIKHIEMLALRRQSG